MKLEINYKKTGKNHKNMEIKQHSTEQPVGKQKKSKKKKKYLGDK